MKNNTIIQRGFALSGLILALFAFTSCQKEIPVGVEDMRQVYVPAEFNFEATKEISLRVKLPATVIYSYRKKIVEILDGAPESGGKIINSGAANNEGIYSTTLKIPVQLNALYVRSFAGQIVLDLGSGTKGLQDEYNADYSEGYYFEAPDTTPDGRPESSGGIIWKQDALKSGGNFVSNPGFENNDFGSQRTWSSNMQTDGKWYFTDLLNSTNTLQVTEGSNKVVQTSTNRTIYGGVAQLIDAEPGEEITFSADIRKLSGSAVVWVYLIPRNSAQSSLTYYSFSYNNPSANWATKTVAATMPANTRYCQVLIWSNNYGGSSVQYDNVVVRIKGRVVDADGDGVEDDEDAYPNDANKAFNSYYPAENQFGTLAFEDMWPTEGDYDFNDLVIGYQFNHIKNASNKITSMQVEFELRAIGASISNGFGFSLDVASNKVESVTNSYTFNANNISKNANGTEAGQSKATIIVFEDAFNVLEAPGGELGVNTKQNGTYVEPVSVNLTVNFTEGLDLSAIGNAPNNPFLFRTKERGQEIHLPGYPPTGLADQSKFGTGDDATNVGNSYFYKTGNGLPWGMNLPVTFVYPIEKVAIIKAHLKFSQWASSGGYSFMDWYLDNEGYRDNSMLYIR